MNKPTQQYAKQSKIIINGNCIDYMLDQEKKKFTKLISEASKISIESLARHFGKESESE